MKTDTEIDTSVEGDDAAEKKIKQLASVPGKKVMDTFQLPAEDKLAVGELAVELGFIRYVGGEPTGNRGPIYQDAVRYVLEHRKEFVMWRSQRAFAAVAKKNGKTRKEVVTKDAQ